MYNGDGSLLSEGSKIDPSDYQTEEKFLQDLNSGCTLTPGDRTFKDGVAGVIGAVGGGGLGAALLSEGIEFSKHGALGGAAFFGTLAIIGMESSNRRNEQDCKSSFTHIQIPENWNKNK